MHCRRISSVLRYNADTLPSIITHINKYVSNQSIAVIKFVMHAMICLWNIVGRVWNVQVLKAASII